MSTTTLASQPPEPMSFTSTALGSTASVAVVAADQLASRRIGGALEAVGLSATHWASDASELLGGKGAGQPDAVVIACDAFDPSALADIRRVADAFRRSHVVVVSSGSDGAGVRQALAAGADGVVFDFDVDATLGPATQSVLVGQLSLPRRLHRCALKPAFSHREKQVLAMVVRGYGNRQIADSLFLAESTVKSHLSSAFQKLGVRSRKEAAALLIDPDEGLGAVLDVQLDSKVLEVDLGGRCP